VTDPLVGELVASLARRKASAQVVPAAEAARAAARAMADAGVARAVLADDPLVGDIGLPDALRREGIEALLWPTALSRREMLGLEGPEDSCGVTVPRMAVAERGTAVLGHPPDMGAALT